MMALDEVSEAAARGKVGEIYADIRATLRVPMVNTIYRHLAVMPDALEWAWSAIRPHMQSGAVARQAEALRRDVERVLDLARPAEAGGLAVPAGQGREAARLVQAYDAANRLNLIAFTQLLHQADADGPTADIAPHAAPGTPGAGDTPMASQDLPAIPALDTLAPDVLARVRRLNQFGEPAAPTVVAGLYRHLAVWPPVLAEVEAWLQPWDRNGALAQARVAAVRSAAGQAASHPLRMAPPAAAIRARFGPPLQRYCQTIIPKMIPVCLLLHHQLERAGAAGR